MLLCDVEILAEELVFPVAITTESRRADLHMHSHESGSNQLCPSHTYPVERMSKTHFAARVLLAVVPVHLRAAVVVRVDEFVRERSVHPFLVLDVVLAEHHARLACFVQVEPAVDLALALDARVEPRVHLAAHFLHDVHQEGHSRTCNDNSKRHVNTLQNSATMDERAAARTLGERFFAHLLAALVARVDRIAAFLRVDQRLERLHRLQDGRF